MSSPTYYGGGYSGGTYAGTQQKLRDKDGNLTGQTVTVGQKPEAAAAPVAKETKPTFAATFARGQGSMARESVAKSQQTQPVGGGPDIAAGKARAMSILMAEGGAIKTDKKGARYQEGRLKGMHVEQARALGEKMWNSASDAVKNKYAMMAANDVAPVERGNGGGGAAMAAFAGGGRRAEANEWMDIDGE